MEPYYYNQMSKLQRTAYHGMLTGFQNLSSEFLVPALEGAELSDIFLKLRLDHPEIFWVWLQNALVQGFRQHHHPARIPV